MIDVTLIHPIINFFTIALFSVSMVLDIVAKINKKERLHYAAWVNLLFTGAVATLSVISGLLADNNVSHNDEVHEIIHTHQTIGFIILGSVLLLLIWRIVLKGTFPTKAWQLYMIIGLTSLGFMFTGAYYGGKMIFKHGEAVKAVQMDKQDDHHHGEDQHHSHD